MPYLMIEFEAHPLKKGERISFKMIDTDNGKIVELEADASSVNQAERAPTPPEMELASRTLGKGIGGTVDQVSHDRVVKERNSYREKVLSAENVLRDVTKKSREAAEKINALTAKLASAEEQTFDQDQKNLIAASLDHYMIYLLDSQQYASYEDAKKLYKVMTGRSYVDEGIEDDQEEDCPDFGRGLGHKPLHEGGDLDRPEDLHGLKPEEGGLEWRITDEMRKMIEDLLHEREELNFFDWGGDFKIPRERGKSFFDLDRIAFEQQKQFYLKQFDDGEQKLPETIGDLIGLGGEDKPEWKDLGFVEYRKKPEQQKLFWEFFEGLKSEEEQELSAKEKIKRLKKKNQPPQHPNGKLAFKPMNPTKNR